MRAALDDLYDVDHMILGRDQDIRIDDDIWNKAIKYVYECGGYDPSMLGDPQIKDLLMATYNTLKEGMGRGISVKVTPELTSALTENVFIFSGCKTHKELVEVSSMLKGEDGGIKPFSRFAADVTSVHSDYNQLYLRAEYRFAQQSATMASKWNSWERRGVQMLQYRTAADDHVRPEHALLDGITRPRDDKFWDTMLPPNGWRCRCTAVPVDPLDAQETDAEDAMRRAASVNLKPKQKIFLFNAGKQMIIFPPKHPYLKTTDEVKTTVKKMAEEITQEEKEKNYIEEMKDQNLTAAEKQLIMRNMLEIEKEMNIKKGAPMTQEAADKQSANPKYDTDRGFRINCQTCTIAYILRGRGFDVTAKAKTAGSKSEHLSRQNSHEAWLDADGNHPEVIRTVDWMAQKGYAQMSTARYREYYEEVCKEEGIYILTVGWKAKFGGGGHATILQRMKDGSLVYVEPQHYNGKEIARPIDELCEDATINPYYKRGIFRADNLAFNVKEYALILDVVRK